MKRSLGWLAMVVALGGCPQTKFVGQLAQSAEGNGEETSATTGDETSAGEADCETQECAPQLLWMHEILELAAGRVIVGPQGRATWFGRSLDDHRPQLVGYDAANDAESIIWGPIGGPEDGTRDLAFDPIYGPRVLVPTVDADEISVVRLDEDYATSWSRNFVAALDGPVPADMALGPDGTTYLLAIDQQSTRTIALAPDGATLWDTTMPEPIDDMATINFPGIVGVHADGFSYFRYRSGDQPLADEAIITRIVDGEVAATLDLADLFPGVGFLINPVQRGDTWMIATWAASGTGVLIAQVAADGAILFEREDPTATGDVFGCAVTDDRIVLVMDDGLESDTELEMRSYDLEGSLRGTVPMNFDSVGTSEVNPQLFPAGAIALPDGTVVVHVFGFDTPRSWLIGVQP